MKVESRLFAAFIPALAAAGPLFAQAPVLWTRINFESSPVAAPVIVLVHPTRAGNQWTASLQGWTLAGGWSGPLNSTTSLVLSAEVTPLNAHSSNYIYSDGERDTEASYRNRTAELKTGLRFRLSDRWLSEAALIGLYESVDDLDHEIEQSWRRPYLGLEVLGEYTNTVSDDSFHALWDGVKASARLRAFTGDRGWWRSELFLGAGKKFRRLFFGARAWWLDGDELDTVNAFLVGGAWELPGIVPLHGYRYAEFRLGRALVVNGGSDVKIGNDSYVGVRGSYLDGSAVSTYGVTLRVSTVRKGIGLGFGIGFPERVLEGGDLSDTVLYGGLTFAVFQPRDALRRPRH